MSADTFATIDISNQRICWARCALPNLRSFRIPLGKGGTTCPTWLEKKRPGPGTGPGGRFGGLFARRLAPRGRDAPAPSLRHPAAPGKPWSARQVGLWARRGMWAARNTRKPLSLLKLFGLFLLRERTRAKPGLLFQEPPRSARCRFRGAPPDDSSNEKYRRLAEKNRDGSLSRAVSEEQRCQCSEDSESVISDGGRAQHPKTAVDVEVARAVPAAREDARETRIIAPGAAAQRTLILASD